MNQNKKAKIFNQSESGQGEDQMVPQRQLLTQSSGSPKWNQIDMRNCLLRNKMGREKISPK